MSDYDHLPVMSEFPHEDSARPSCKLPVTTHATGLMVAQDGDDLYRLMISLFTGETPMDGAVTFTLDAEAAREVAKHILHIADYAELGVESAPVPE